MTSSHQCVTLALLATAVGERVGWGGGTETLEALDDHKQEVCVHLPLAAALTLLANVAAAASFCVLFPST